MRSVYTIILTVVVAAVTVYLVRPTTSGAGAHTQETAYDRVMRTGTLRCGYAPLEPIFMMDPNTKKFSGIYKDLVENIGKSLSLKVEWAEEVSPGDMAVALSTGRIDAMCTGLWLTGARSRAMLPIKPLIFSPIYVAVRADDTRFDKDPGLLNNPAYTLAIIDGTAQAQIAARHFPHTKQFTLPQMTHLADTLVAVTQGKADFVTMSYDTILAFMAKNPGQIKILDHALSDGTQAVAVMPWVMYIGLGEQPLANMITGAIDELQAFDMITPIIDKYEPAPHTFKRARAGHN